MKEGSFVGKSDTGNFQEALQNAIAIAKKTLETDFITWEIEKIYGEDGGYVTVNILSLQIHAQGPKH
jgi:hypothetical protein